MTDPISILLVEDNPLNARFFRRLLEGNGHEVHVARTAWKALMALEHLRPRLILTDIQLPGLDGLEFTRMLRADKRFQHMKIVGVSALALPEDERRALEAGCDAYITKPIAIPAFLSTVEGFLTGRDV